MAKTLIKLVGITSYMMERTSVLFFQGTVEV
jgi:hypothetical protein